MIEHRFSLLRFQLVNKFGDPLNGEIRYSPSRGKRPVIIVCHSFMAFKDWGFFPHIGEQLVGAGFAVVTFNFSLNGVENNNNRITSFGQFQSNTFSRELHDLGTIVDAVSRNTIGIDAIDSKKIGLLGHSRGGGIAIVFAAADERIGALATFSAISTFDRWTPHQKTLWRERGFLPLARNSTVSPLRLGLDLLHDVEEHADELSITNAAGRMNMPWLIIHGREDLTVRCHEAEVLHAAANPALTKLMILDHVSHLYNAASEAEDNYATLDSVLLRTSNWFQDHFQQE